MFKVNSSSTLLGAPTCLPNVVAESYSYTQALGKILHQPSDCGVKSVERSAQNDWTGSS